MVRGRDPQPGPHSPLTLWHLLSLDAPTVAVLWTWFLGRTAGLHLSFACCAAMFLAVWILYAGDRLLDARCLRELRSTSPQRVHGRPPTLELRHVFHHRHRLRFAPAIAVAALLLASLIPRLPGPALRLYSIEGGLLLVWLGLVHGFRVPVRLPKEFVVGAFFSAAVFIPTVARHPGLRPALLPAAVLFAGVCTLNCLFIHAWESRPNHPSDHPPDHSSPIHPLVAAAAAHLTALGCAGIAFAAALGWALPAQLRPVAVACLLATALLLTLHAARNRFGRTPLRAAADLALLTPLLLLPWLR